MSYARKGQPDSDVYVIACTCGNYECLACNIEKMFTSHNADGMIRHLIRHRTIGDKVPDRTFARLREEMV